MYKLCEGGIIKIEMLDWLEFFSYRLNSMIVCDMFNLFFYRFLFWKEWNKKIKIWSDLEREFLDE